jgi:hypothetical protein
MDLPVANHWFRVERVTPDITLLVERHLDRFFESTSGTFVVATAISWSTRATGSATCAESWPRWWMVAA